MLGEIRKASQRKQKTDLKRRSKSLQGKQRGKRAFEMEGIAWSK